MRQQQKRAVAPIDGERWLKPDPNRLQCDINASFSNASNRVGIGACIRNDSSGFVLVKTEYFSKFVRWTKENHVDHCQQSSGAMIIKWKMWILS